LVVVATPDALKLRKDGKPNWVVREIEFFLGLPQGTHIFVVRAKGGFDEDIPADLLNRFPQVTMVDLRQFSTIADSIFLRNPIRQHLLTIVASLHDIEQRFIPELRMEEAQNARTRATRLAIVAIFLLLTISGLAIAALMQRNLARTERNNAQREAVRANQNASEAQTQRGIAQKNAAEAQRQAETAKKNETEARKQQAIAEKNSRIAERNARESHARELVAYANASLEEDPERSVLLAIRAVETTVKHSEPALISAENMLHTALITSRVRFTLRGHGSSVVAVKFSPDGKRVVTGSTDHTARLWDASSGREIVSLATRSSTSSSARPQRGRPAYPRGVAFSPDGTRVASAADNDKIRIWNSASGTEVLAIEGHSAPVTSLAFASDGKRIASASDDRTARIWDADTGQVLLTIRMPQQFINGIPVASEAFESLSFSPDGTKLATTTREGTVKIWDAFNGRELLTIKGSHATSIAYSPDGKRLAGIDVRNIRIWDPTDGHEILVIPGHANAETAVVFSPDGKRLATAGADSTASVWDAVTKEELLRLRGHTLAVTDLAFSPDGRSLITVSADTTAKIWEVGPGSEEFALEWAVADPISLLRVDPVVAISANGKRLATDGPANTARILDLTTGKLLSVLRGHSSAVLGVALSSDGSHLATSSWDRTAKLWDLSSGKEQFTFRGFTAPLHAVTISPDDRYIAAGGGEGTVTIWNVADGRESLQIKQVYDVRVLAFTPDSRRLATGTWAGTVQIWNTATGQQVLRLEKIPSNIGTLAFSHDGKLLAISSYDETVRVWDVGTGKQLLSINPQHVVLPFGGRLVSSPATFLSFSLDNKRLAIAGWGHTMGIWSTITGQQLLNLGEHPNRVIVSSFGVDGKRLTAYSGATLQVYDMDMGDLLKLARRRVTREPPALTDDECRRYFDSDICPGHVNGLRGVDHAPN
jgi:WD40 repeat protein